MSTQRLPLPRSYWRQWTASLISNLGDGVAFVAMPLLALTITGDERLLALVALATLLPWFVLALPIGVLVDRRSRKHLMIVANIVRVGLFALIAVGAHRDQLSIWGLFGLLLLIGACEAVFDSAASAFLPQIVDGPELGRANGLLFAAEIIAGSIAGLSVGAVLFDVDRHLPFTVDAASFAVAAVLVATVAVRTPSPPAATATNRSADRQLRVGLRWLWQNPLLRTLAAMLAVTNLGLMLTQGIFAKFAVTELGLSSLEFGLLLAISAMGAGAGGLAGPRLMDRFGTRAGVIAPFFVFGIGNLVIGVASQPWIVAVAGFVIGFAITTWNVVTVTARQRLIPNEMFGRVNSVFRWISATASAMGIALGGVIAHATTLRAPFIVGSATTLLAAIAFGQPVLRGLAKQD